MPKKLTQDNFISRAISIHGNDYDYSSVNYANMNTKVKIYCNRCHCYFMQEPAKHIKSSGSQGCPKCRYERARNTLEKKYGPGITNPMHIEEAKKKQHDTVKRNYHVDNVMRVESIRKAQEDSCERHYGKRHYSQTDEWKIQIKETSRKKYNKDSYSQTDECKQKVRETSMKHWNAPNIMQSKEGVKRLSASVYARYGVPFYTITDACRNGYKKFCMDNFGVSHYSKTDEYKEKVKDTCLKEFGADTFFGSQTFAEKRDEYQMKARLTCKGKYGTEYYSQSREAKDRLPETNRKSAETKRRNHSFNDSKPEKRLYKMLCDKFGEGDVVRQYRSKVYPSACDFHVKSMDCYIELNGTWAHGHRWFDENNPECMKQLQKLKRKAESGNYYFNVIHSWTNLDVRKRRAAAKSNLNYVVFWDCNLKDAERWFELGCPVGHDWIKEYSWME